MFFDVMCEVYVQEYFTYKRKKGIPILEKPLFSK